MRISIGFGFCLVAELCQAMRVKELMHEENSQNAAHTKKTEALGQLADNDERYTSGDLRIMRLPGS